MQRVLRESNHKEIRRFFGGSDTRAMKKRLGVSDKKPLADVLPDVTLAAKNLAGSMTAYNIENKNLYGIFPIEKEHVENSEGVRSTLVDRGIYPEDLPPAEDTKKVEQRLKSDEKKLSKTEKGFLNN